jgi:hypothetical protein
VVTRRPISIAPGRLAARLLVACAAAASPGCFDDVATTFPPGLEPLEANEAPRPDDVSRLSIVDGEDESYMWSHGRGLVPRPPGEVWAAAKDAGVMVHVCASDEQTVKTGVDPDHEYSFEVHYVVDTIVTVEWDEVWRFGTVEGTPADPELAMVRYQKTFGSDAIELLEGSVQILATDDPDVTEVQFVEHVDAFGGSLEDLRRSMIYRFDSLLAAVGEGGAPRCVD